MQHFLSKSRYVVAQPLSKEELPKIYHQHACFRNRQRAHAILLSQRGLQPKPDSGYSTG
jgi:hypothetical protein